MKALYYLLLLTAVILLLVFGSSAIHWLSDYSGLSRLSLLLLVCMLYALLLALPFIPGMEIGLFIMAAFGTSGVIGAWLATVVGLNLAYLVGFSIYGQSPVRFFRYHYLLFIRQQRQRNSLFARALFALRHHPYLVLALLFNVPGNALIGGGGGISLLAGASHQLQWHYFALVTLLATSVIPLLILSGLVMLN